ncbi:unnamed protein product [Adineta ricciae]|uniref:Uncharacterized protein n=1 Tax=Adineta ricciae TaxID=249248 RepID=A0A813URC9_ADIRI|nr:unnamed protein product [Adineta ricciae]
MVKSLFIRRYQILAVVSSFIIVLLVICFVSPSWRTIETGDAKMISHFHSPFRYDTSLYNCNHANKTFKLYIGPLWRCLSTKINGKQSSSPHGCSINDESFDYVLILIGIGSFVLFTLISICIQSGCFTNSMTIVRLCTSFTLELAALSLLYGLFHVQKVIGPLHGWASIGFFLGIICIIIICVLEWDDYFRDFYRKHCAMEEINTNDRVNVWVSGTIRTELDES